MTNTRYRHHVDLINYDVNGLTLKVYKNKKLAVYRIALEDIDGKTIDYRAMTMNEYIRMVDNCEVDESGVYDLKSTDVKIFHNYLDYLGFGEVSEENRG